MMSEANEKTKDKIVLEEYDINNLNKETIKDYRIRFRIHKGETHEWNKLNDEEFLYMLNAIDRKTKKLTIAGLLMFGQEKDIVDIFPNYFLDYREVKDKNNMERWKNRITSWDDGWTGNLWDFFEKIINKLTTDIKVPFALDKDLMRIDDTPVHICIREALSNCLIHTQYDESGSIMIEKSENCFKFANPGNMRVSIEDALKGGQSDPRNPILHKMFSYLGYGERAGSGLPMINNVWKENGWVLPKIKESFNPNRTTLILITKSQNPPINPPINPLINPLINPPINPPMNLNETQQNIISILLQNRKIKIDEITNILGLKSNTIKKNIKQLKDMKLIERKGTTRNGEWIIKSKNDQLVETQKSKRFNEKM